MGKKKSPVTEPEIVKNDAPEPVAKPKRAKVFYVYMTNTVGKYQAKIRYKLTETELKALPKDSYKVLLER